MTWTWTRRKPPSGKSHHARVEIERVDRVSAEQIEDQLRPDSATAAKLEGMPAARGTAHSEQAPRLERTLDRGTDRVVHEGVFDAVEKHGSCFGLSIPLQPPAAAFGGQVGCKRKNI